MLCHCGKSLIETRYKGIWKYFIFNAYCTNCKSNVWNCKICNDPLDDKSDTMVSLLGHLYLQHQFKTSSHIIKMKMRHESGPNYCVFEADGILHNITQYVHNNEYLMFVCKDDKITYSCGEKTQHGTYWQQPPIELMRELKSGDAYCAGCRMDFDSFPDEALYISHLVNCPAMQLAI